MKTALVVFFVVVENSTSFYIHKSSIIPLLSAVEPYFDLIKANTTQSRADKKISNDLFPPHFSSRWSEPQSKMFPKVTF